MKFSCAETRDILANNVVHCKMQDVVLGMVNRPLVPTRPTPPWRYAGQNISTGPFRLFRGCVQMAVEQAVAAAADKERERLLSVLRMVEGDPVEPVAHAVGLACEEYAVLMQHGADGWRNYQEFTAPYES